jgi:hypothetical protein
MPATTWIPESPSNSPKRMPSFMANLLIVPLFFYSPPPPPPLLSPTSGPFDFYFFLSLYPYLSETRRSEGQRVLSRGQTGHTHTHTHTHTHIKTNVSPSVWLQK